MPRLHEDEGCPGKSKEQTGINRMPHEPIGPGPDQRVPDAYHWLAAPVRSQVEACPDGKSKASQRDRNTCQPDDHIFGHDAERQEIGKHARQHDPDDNEEQRKERKPGSSPDLYRRSRLICQDEPE